MDVASHQPAVNWSRAWNQGARFAYVKATEATSYTNPLFTSQTSGATNAGMLHGAYHFAIPNVSSGARQANYFVDRGGKWTADGNTLPPLLDIEYNPYSELGDTCYDMSAREMIAWIRDFSSTVAARTGRVPMIYTTTDWWKTCTGNSNAFANHPLHIANYAKSPGSLPNGWGKYTLWQYSSTGPFEGDSNVYNGSLSQLRDFARGSRIAGPAKLYFQGNPVSSLAYGHTTDEFVTCDWDGDGIATPAAFRNGVWYIRNGLTGNASVTELRYGEKGDIPICGDWDGDGLDTLGVYRKGMAYLRNSNTTGKADGTFPFGAAYDIPLVGDWNGDGYDTLGVARMEGVGKRFYLTDSNIRPAVSHTFIYGNAGDTPISGDWNNDGFSTVGVQRSNIWHLTDDHSTAATTSRFAFGNPDDRPLTGQWSRGTGTSVGVIR
nr:lysozyme [Arthrobacter zhangbolii]